MTVTEDIYRCPTWAFDPRNRDQRPRTQGKWQPIWDPIAGRNPMPGHETYVAQLLDAAGIIWLYEPLLLPIRRNTILPDPNLRRHRIRRLLRNDFFLPNLNCIIEVYSGRSEATRESKHRRLTRMSRLHGLPFVLLGIPEFEQLVQNPGLLTTWITSSTQVQAA